MSDPHSENDRKSGHKLVQPLKTQGSHILVPPVLLGWATVSLDCEDSECSCGVVLLSCGTASFWHGIAVTWCSAVVISTRCCVIGLWQCHVSWCYQVSARCLLVICWHGILHWWCSIPCCSISFGWCSTWIIWLLCGCFTPSFHALNDAHPSTLLCVLHLRCVNRWKSMSSDALLMYSSTLCTLLFLTLALKDRIFFWTLVFPEKLHSFCIDILTFLLSLIPYLQFFSPWCEAQPLLGDKVHTYDKLAQCLLLYDQCCDFALSFILEHQCHCDLFSYLDLCVSKSHQCPDSVQVCWVSGPSQFLHQSDCFIFDKEQEIHHISLS